MSISRLASLWDRYEIPTWLLAGGIYLSWASLVWRHASIPWWILLVLGAWFTAWHASLQHETIHALSRTPRWLRGIIAGLPLGLGFPYSLYAREHTQHHRNNTLTDPQDDPETFYHAREQWEAYHPALRALYLINQTVAGRMLVGAPLHLAQLYYRETLRISRGDYSHLKDLVSHVLLVALLFVWVSWIAGMAWWEYVLLFAYPGMCLASLRSFVEHRWAEDAAQRTAIVEGDFPWGILFLYNNLHAVHHQAPTLPWYKIRAQWNAQRLEFAQNMPGYYFSGYRQIIARWFFRPVFVPVHELAAGHPREPDNR